MRSPETPAAQSVWRSLRVGMVLSLLALAVSNPTAIAVSQQVVTFDNVPGAVVDAELDGQFPTSVIDWGKGSWYLSGPWQELSDNSISFTEDLNSATFRFLSPRQLVSLLAYNGGDKAATVTLSCPEQSSTRFELAKNEVATLNTGWAGTCSQVTISTSNGWFTNFDKLVIQ